jgi:imidazolonepropionase-like amidohydrolase
MGAVALVRQAFRDALWWHDAQASYASHPAQARPKLVSSNVALVPAAQGKQTVIFEATDVLSLLRAAKIAQEFKLNALYVGAGDEYRLRDQVAALRPNLILRVDFAKPERVDDEAEWLDVPLQQLRQIDRAPSNPKWLRDAGLMFSLSTAGLENAEDFPRRVREAMARGLSRADALAALTVVPARQLGLGQVLGSLEPGKIANLTVATGEPFAIGARVSEIWIDGKRHELPEKKPRAGGRSERDTSERDGKESPETPLAPDVRPFVASEEGVLAAPKALIVRGATLWTEGTAGIIDGADLIAVGGKITAIGRNLAIPAGALVLDAKGKHLTPGIIDAHSHSGIDGNVNEGTHNITAEVRIKDVLNPFDVAIYRELAGGTTAANVLHGSANAIGGQSATVKWRWGGGPDDLLIAGAPEGIKFALGENPKQSNFDNPTPRYPRTRMGVMDLIRERFAAARDYLARREEYRKSKGGLVPPAPDLQLEAIAEILQHKRMIHCHGYRKDEILEMMRLAEQFGIRVAAFHHVLEGYKIADEMARHGAGGSSFSDWWAYKVEAYDAIPYSGALMRERGVLVSFNSDSGELARRLNLEASKAVKYGGVPPADALAFVTANAAKQLGVFDRIGSLEVGKDADLVLWSGDPLATSSIALQSWIEGKKYFDRTDDLARRPKLEQERGELVAKAKKHLPPKGEPKRAPEEPEKRPSPPGSPPNSPRT